MDVVIETDRLLLRKFTEGDAPLLYELNLDPEVIRYTHDQ
jgi:RimJ/RimL family protein N-acetyltransferase